MGHYFPSPIPPNSKPLQPQGQEKEIVELFRKVQAQLRERAAVKEDKKVEASKGKGKESETVDSLLKLLRKHSIEQRKKKVSSQDFAVDHQEQSRSQSKDKSTSFLNLNDKERSRVPEPNSSSFTRPPSNFQRKSPVPQTELEPEEAELALEQEPESSFLKEDLSSLKLPGLRAIAKTRGIKGFSKMKKGELVKLLSGGQSDK
ncbi:hypothetical protein GH714_027241 [Hevea brasiliensis]|uniref:Rho termination factor-like N-terminal domain-containing protein n=1 Tax=Hevea brasiliensis TaxID=3981 RepID=A0A6A6KX23_HEVBR|nr:hypothetical protein GH714_027241 [Hevea brasiliensis]